jgi:hypothetical protein
MPICALHEETLGLCRAAGKHSVAARTVEALNLYGLSELAFGEGDYPRARARAEEALAVARELGWTSPRNSPQIMLLKPLRQPFAIVYSRSSPSASWTLRQA